MNYIEQLNTIEWKEKRLKILTRDHNKCKECSNKILLSNCNIGYIDKHTQIPKLNPYNNKYILNYRLFNSEVLGMIFLNQNQTKEFKLYSFIYTKESKKGKDILIAIRKATLHEKKIFEKYDKKFNFEYNPFDIENSLALRIKIESERENELINLSDIEKKEFTYVNGLHIHHKYYVKNLKAWEYDDTALTTLCFECHENLHKNQTIPVYNNTNHLIGKYHYCKRCHGAGIFPEYSHIQNGICFRCSGNRFEELTP